MDNRTLSGMSTREIRNYISTNCEKMYNEKRAVQKSNDELTHIIDEDGQLIKHEEGKAS